MKRRQAWIRFAIVQVVFVIALGIAYARLSSTESAQLKNEIANVNYLPTVKVTRETPLVVEPFYDDQTVVTDEELAAVLMKIRPKFDAVKLKPNYVEHALRAWSIHAEFQDDAVMSGAQMLDFMTDHGKYIASWKTDQPTPKNPNPKKTLPLFIEKPQGVDIRYVYQKGANEQTKQGASVHHDHWLACLTEAGVALDQPVFTPNRQNMTVNDVLQEALRNFRLDEKEVEWSAMAFGLWLAPETNQWRTTSNRILSFDLLAKRLMRGTQKWGVCGGTHRVYSLMLLWRLNNGQSLKDQPPLLSPAVRDAVWAHLESVRDEITVSQFPDGHWTPNWYLGKAAFAETEQNEEYKQVIATGHHLEWLAIAPKELHPPHEQIVKAAKWIIKTTTEHSDEQIQEHYTFYSHVGNALALWRHTHPAKFWKTWQQSHPYQKPVKKIVPAKPVLLPTPKVGPITPIVPPAP